MRIYFKITDLPETGQENYLISYIEGTVKIFIRKNIYFDQPGIPLVEFALNIDRWLNNIRAGKIIDFIYESMDFDKPILSIIRIKGKYYKIDSVWQETEIKEFLSQNEIVNEFEHYLINLANELKKQKNIELERFLIRNRF